MGHQGSQFASPWHHVLHHAHMLMRDDQQYEVWQPSKTPRDYAWHFCTTADTLGVDWCVFFKFSGTNIMYGLVIGLSA
jgi:hypothetical protein